MPTKPLLLRPGWIKPFVLAGIVLCGVLPAAAATLPVKLHYVPPGEHSMVRNKAIQPITPVVEDGTPEMTFDVTSGHIPAGLALWIHTGVIEGTPTESGVFDLTVKVSTSDGREAMTRVHLVID